MADKQRIIDLLADEIKDLYSAEKQLTKAIPKMANGSNSQMLQEAFKGHLAETLEQVKRLEAVAKMIKIKRTGEKCAGMEGVIQEAAEVLDEEGEAVSLLKQSLAEEQAADGKLRKIGAGLLKATPTWTAGSVPSETTTSARS